MNFNPNPEDENKRAIDFMLQEMTGTPMRRPTIGAMLQIPFDSMGKLLVAYGRRCVQEYIEAQQAAEEKKETGLSKPTSRFDRMEYSDRGKKIT